MRVCPVEHSQYTVLSDEEPPLPDDPVELAVESAANPVCSELAASTLKLIFQNGELYQSRMAYTLSVRQS